MRIAVRARASAATRSPRCAQQESRRADCWCSRGDEGVVVGSGLADRVGLSRRGGFAAPRVLRGVPASGSRRRRVLRRLAEHCDGARACPRSAPRSTTTASLAFAERFGFVEVDREIEQTRIVGDEPLASRRCPRALDVVISAERPGLWEAGVRPLGLRGPGRLRRATSPSRSPPSGGRRPGGVTPMFLALQRR